MESVKSSIDNVMQCLLDLRSCLYYLGIRGDDGRSDTHAMKVKAAVCNAHLCWMPFIQTAMVSHYLYFQVIEAKNHYDSSIQQLHHIIKNSCNQLPFSYLWTRLDFNGFLGDNNEISLKEFCGINGYIYILPEECHNHHFCQPKFPISPH